MLTSGCGLVKTDQKGSYNVCVDCGKLVQKCLNLQRRIALWEWRWNMRVQVSFLSLGIGTFHICTSEPAFDLTVSLAVNPHMSKDNVLRVQSVLPLRVESSSGDQSVDLGQAGLQEFLQ